MLNGHQERLMPEIAVHSIVKTAREHHDISLAKIIIDPAENYRWGSQQAMQADMASPAFAVLQASVADAGVQDPVGLVKRGDDYHVVYGFSRCLAARQAGIKTVPAYVYEPTLSATETQLLQLRENSKELRRPVCWIHEVRVWRRLVDETAARYAGMPDESRPKEGGKVLPPGKAAAKEISRLLGKEPNTYYDLEAQLKHLHPRVVESAIAYGWSQYATLEFFSGDAKAPYAGDFVVSVLGRLTAEFGTLAGITPEAVRRAKRQVAAAVKNVFVGGAEPTTVRARKRMEGDSRMGPGIARDACVDCFDGIIQKGAVTPEDADAKLRNGPVWNKVIGIGMAIGEVSLPACAGGNSQQPPDAVDQAHKASGDRWALQCLVHAYLRRHVASIVGNFEEWAASTEEVDGEKRYHRREFHSSVAASVQRAVTARSFTLKDAIGTAFVELRDRVSLKNTRKPQHAKNCA